MQFPEKMTIGEAYGPAMEIQTQAEADEYFEAPLNHYQGRFTKTREEAVEIIRENLGYYAGYCDNETRERVERLFHCAHPVFGAIAINGVPTPEEAFEMGRELAKRGNDA